MAQKLVVQKYGGATLSDPQKIKAVAERISELHHSGTQIVAVVSAMGKTTNLLIDLANQVSNRPNRRELDMLLSTGERVSMALVTMALHDLKCAAISFTGSQAGILTNESHFNAFITDVKAIRVDEALLQKKVVVLAGFQGVSPKTKEITTLGRGGSDSSAVAMAAYLKADVCEILKEVPGVFTADPNLIPNSKKISELNYDQLYEMTFWGAKVLYYRSVELARSKNVPLFIGSATDKTANGTHITMDLNRTEEKILAANSHEEVLKISFADEDIEKAKQELEVILDKMEIAFPQIISVKASKSKSSFFFTGPHETLSAIKKELKTFTLFELDPQNYCSVTLTFSQRPAQSVIDKIRKEIKAKIEREILSDLSFSVIAAAENRLSLLKLFHEKI